MGAWASVGLGGPEWSWGLPLAPHSALAISGRSWIRRVEHELRPGAPDHRTLSGASTVTAKLTHLPTSPGAWALSMLARCRRHRTRPERRLVASVVEGCFACRNGP